MDFRALQIRHLRAWMVSFEVMKLGYDVPGLEADIEAPFTSIVCVGVEGVCEMEMYLYPPTLLPAMT